VRAAQHRSIRDDLEALAHARQCVIKGCTRGSETLRSGKCRVLRHNNPDAWHNAELAREVIMNGALSVQVRSGWHAPGENAAPEEYALLLAWGGPSAHIIGDLDEWAEPSTARFQYQDWFRPWTDAHISSADEQTLLE
jgi:hypothetical protein